MRGKDSDHQLIRGSFKTPEPAPGFRKDEDQK